MKRIACSCLVATLVALPGCSEPAGPQTMRVWGDVSYDDKPVEEGTIEFVSPDGAVPAQASIKAGHYDLPAPSGPMAEKSYVVQINALKKSGKTIPNVMGDGAPTMDVLVNVIPETYNVKSTLKANVSTDTSKNQFDFKLEKPGRSK
ncbi:hypothetical protein [Singulisphaera acidiphila]|uniref:Uncharacterized protein n=1 Tax=Singulisphaera acidiphila (strain ATCC BAA-1392 / DSM 18658 / VKM B-2454 / MOB10) TaxID=886293 RepID=L0DDX5_SINAD|nr:hypothetical protein [Singulisphaera acidiphila]AGA27442.1 hypothetical protein Sinac_3169 [Singulisphaera acidiphila DSM 18658]